jgi:hypothetical protein
MRRALSSRGCGPPPPVLTTCASSVPTCQMRVNCPRMLDGSSSGFPSPLLPSIPRARPFGSLQTAVRVSLHAEVASATIVTTARRLENIIAPEKSNFSIRKLSNVMSISGEVYVNTAKNWTVLLNHVGDVNLGIHDFAEFPTMILL